MWTMFCLSHSRYVRPAGRGRGPCDTQCSAASYRTAIIRMINGFVLSIDRAALLDDRSFASP